jgi:hypothetical protein
MRYIFIVLLTLVFLIPAFAQEELVVAPSNLVYNWGIAYFNGVRFTGLMLDEKDP